MTQSTPSAEFSGKLVSDEFQISPLNWVAKPQDEAVLTNFLSAYQTVSKADLLLSLYLLVTEAKKKGKHEKLSEEHDYLGYKILQKSDVYRYGNQLIPTGFCYMFFHDINIGAKIKNNLRDKTISVFLWDTTIRTLQLNSPSEYDETRKSDNQVFEGELKIDQIYDVRTGIGRNSKQFEVQNFKVSDEHGSYMLTLWNDDINTFKGAIVGDTINVKTKVLKDAYGIKLTYTV